MWYNPLIKLLLRSPLHGMVSKGILLLDYTGRKSGKKYSVPLSYVRQDGDLLIVSFRKRTWWRSLVGGQPVSIRLAGKQVPATAEAIAGDPEQVAVDLGLYLMEQRSLAKYFHVSFDDDGRPDPDELVQAAEKRVMVRIRPDS